MHHGLTSRFPNVTELCLVAALVIYLHPSLDYINLLSNLMIHTMRGMCMRLETTPRTTQFDLYIDRRCVTAPYLGYSGNSPKTTLSSL